MVAYGGDEILALVLDVGTSWTRAGYAGDDTPKVVVPSYVGSLAVPEEADKRPTPVDEAMDVGTGDTAAAAANCVKRKQKYAIGDGEVNLWRPDMEVVNPVKGGVVEDWDVLESLWDYALRSRLRVDPREHPLFLSESSWNTREARERTVELAFETFGAPASFMCRNAVLSAFAAGRSSALVLDCGGGTTSAVSVYDGYVLRKSIQRSSIGGDFLSQQAIKMLETTGTEIVPQFLVKSKNVVHNGVPGAAVLREELLPRTTQSYMSYAKMKTVAEIKDAVCQVSEVEYDERTLAARPLKTYEFPNGVNRDFGVERYRIPEMLFHPGRHVVEPDPSIEAALGIHQLAQQSISSCDADARPHLYGNLVLTGGGSQFNGLPDRFHAELVQLAPGVKLKVHAPGNTVERKYSTWLGGSILASLGTFHQLWISKKEYEEHGASIVERKCR